MPVLQPGDQFPTLTFSSVAHGDITLPDELSASIGIVLLFRGAWCPYCNAQLRSFQRSQPQLEELGAKLVALSVDDEPTSHALSDKLGLTFPLGHSADARAVAAATGAFVNEEPLHLQSTGFLLDPSGKVLLSVYSSGAIGRLVPEDVVGMLRYLKEHA